MIYKATPQYQCFGKEANTSIFSKTLEGLLYNAMYQLVHDAVEDGTISADTLCGRFTFHHSNDNSKTWIETAKCDIHQVHNNLKQPNWGKSSAMAAHPECTFSEVDEHDPLHVRAAKTEQATRKVYALYTEEADYAPDFSTYEKLFKAIKEDLHAGPTRNFNTQKITALANRIHPPEICDELEEAVAHALSGLMIDPERYGLSVDRPEGVTNAFLEHFTLYECTPEQVDANSCEAGTQVPLDTLHAYIAKELEEYYAR